MGARPQLIQSPSAPAGHALPVNSAILNGWKQIARYLGRGIRTAQRWECELAMPVHRPKGKNRSAVFALASELDSWLQRTPVRLNGNGNEDEAAPTPEIGAVLLDLARDLLIYGERLVKVDEQHRPEVEKLIRALREVERELTELGRMNPGTKPPQAA